MVQEPTIEDVLIFFGYLYIDCLIAVRDGKRKRGEFERADFIRKFLKGYGIKLIDKKDETIWEWYKEQ